MPSFSSLLFTFALTVSSHFAYAANEEVVSVSQSLNIFGLPPNAKIAPDAADAAVEEGRKLQTVATGWLYATSNGGNTDCNTVNTYVGTITNTCLVSGLDTENNAQNSILYTCDSSKSFKTIFSTLF